MKVQEKGRKGTAAEKKYNKEISEQVKRNKS